MIPNFLKPVLRPIYRCFASFRLYWVLRIIGYKHKSRDELHRYWRHPLESDNVPQEYVDGEAKSSFLVHLIEKYVNTGKIIEIGCNVGRNLNHLYLAGFRELTGIEINENACRLLKEHYPDMARDAQIYNKPIEEVIGEFGDREFNVVFTMAVLEHIHTDSEWIFPEVARIANKLLITIEAERWYSQRHFPRNYKEVFEPLGMKQIEAIACSDDNGLGGYIARVFER
ncbi:class I SAM-dependent methyltransferase [Chloroflexota bacterium]